MFKKSIRLMLALSIGLLLGQLSFAEGTAADNTQMNQRDANNQTLTPPDQGKGTDAEVELTRKIRQDLVADKRLSADAKNVKIITLSKTITLRGPVKSNTEMKRVLAKAKHWGQGMKINNEMEIIKK